MPSTRAQRARVMLRTNLPWRRLWGNRMVRRHVQGVDLYMPWSHVLPDYVRARSYYGQNLVELAAGLAERARPGDRDFKLLDIGANIGDSALQVLKRVGGEALCVEGDPYWARYLEMNVGEDRRVTVEKVLLTPTDESSEGMEAVRGLGTTQLVPTENVDDGLPQISAAELRARNPEFSEVRLIKSDTDGFDPALVPAAARAWSDCDPVLFFEFDPILAREVSGQDPNRIWAELEQLGYSRLAIWDNGADPLGRLDVSDAVEAARELEPRPVDLGYFFWDVAACRPGDSGALEVFDQLMPEPFVPGADR
jgi:FkbM family methyltransferase